jgi:hypothetical protein
MRWPPEVNLRHFMRPLQLRLLSLGFFQDGHVRIGVFPEGEKIFVSGERTDAGGIGTRASFKAAATDCRLRLIRVLRTTSIGLQTSNSRL